MVVITPSANFGAFKNVEVLPKGLQCDDVFLPFTVIGNTYEISNDNSLAPPPPTIKPVVPKSVTRRQAVQQLIIEGLDDDVEAVIAAIPDATQRKLFTVWYKDSQVFERDRPEILMVWQALGRTQEQLDNTFIAAAKL